MVSMDGMTLSNAPNDPPDGQSGTTNTTNAIEDLEDGEIDDENSANTQASGNQSQMDIDDGASNASTPREASSVASSRSSSRAVSPVRKKATTHSKQSSEQKSCSTKSDASVPHSPIPMNADTDTSKAINSPSLISRIESLESSTSPLHPQLPTPDESPPPNNTQISHLTSKAEAESEPETDPTTFLLTPEELDRAKSLVLDLLGWGVEPEYLVYCGVSQPAIYKIFTDLRLRLPTNLDYPP
ncbi:hypothetical protein BDQ12DRAFT_728814 [Crucibulum laeve]|uniref:Uncharacterized protein n=1 Tax=Crucibulum laeve TaxID=68775 RepID=A0A5C3LGJ1_9AGAR|nr:hypothetical protein BDQ12DRAFT_728814 [Crucibulum laeve]